MGEHFEFVIPVVAGSQSIGRKKCHLLDRVI